MKKLLVSALFVSIFMPSVAKAKAAKCFTTDDGYYKCNFKKTDKAGSFEIRARGKPGYNIIVEEPGFASGYLQMNGRGTPINGKFVKQRDDGACWNNPEQNTKVCVW
jgi:hypothetical protein